MFDTDVIIWILRGREDVVKKAKEIIRQSGGEVFISAIQIAEILAGARPQEIGRILEFLGKFGVVEIGKETGRLAGEFMNSYGKSHGVKIADALIAASVVENDLRLWTMNRKHYPMIRERLL